ncbi:MAG: sigma 54-interacting transcriptional regulator [Polyangia bacterium]
MIDEVFLFYRQDAAEDEVERLVFAGLQREIQKRQSDIVVGSEVWHSDDPADHQRIFEFLREVIPKVRRRLPEHTLLVHISPGTPAMQTILVLMAETGFIDRPFEVIKSMRASERRGQPAVVRVEVGIDTFYQVYRFSSEGDPSRPPLLWEPTRFRSPRLRAVFEEARRFALLKVPVLILGERGTGKTTLAAWMRAHSPFRRREQDKNWPAIACGQYTPETMRAELFGYRKGAFTGAVADRDGLLKAAHMDSLFLDEIGDISYDLQRLLIKAIEERRYQPLGDTAYQDSDFRLICATNLNFAELRRRIAPDFWDRVSQLQLRLPSLREIPDDLQSLWEEMFERAIQRAGVKPATVKLSASYHRRIVATLQSHPLPGNLRDLYRVAYRLLAALADPKAPLAPAEAVDFALAGLEQTGGVEGSESLSRSTARAFADAQPLSAVLPDGASLPTEEVLREFRQFIAQELRRLAKQRRIDVESLCDRTERSLRSWATGRKDSSD